MTLGFDVALRNTRAASILALIDGGAAGGTIKIYNGTRPATGGAVTTLLGTLTFADPAGTVSASAVFTASAITRDSAADATGTATWFRVGTSVGTFCFDGSITQTSGGGDLELVTQAIVSGQPIEISSFVLTEGNQ